MDDVCKVQISFVATTISRPAVGPIQLPIQWVPGDVLPGKKRRRLSLRLKGTINPISHTFSVMQCITKHVEIYVSSLYNSFPFTCSQSLFFIFAGLLRLGH